MDKLEHYRQIVQQILRERSQIKLAYGNIETETIFDIERDQYQIVDVGWDQEGRYVHDCPIHIAIKEGKIWLQWNSTENDIAADLVAAGVPKQDIVLRFQSPFMRQFTDYAVG